jgi:hypothetical protein
LDEAIGHLREMLEYQRRLWIYLRRSLSRGKSGLEMVRAAKQEAVGGLKA